MKMKAFLRGAFSILASVSILHSAAANPPTLRLTVELRDGSRVVGTGTDNYFKFHSGLLGDLKLAVQDIRSVECVSSNTVKLVTAGGDALTVAFVDTTLAIQTSFGKVDLQVSSVRKISVSFSPPGGTDRAGLVGYWSGHGNVQDSAGKNDGTLMGGADYADGRTGQAFSFNGVSSYVEIPDDDSLRLTKELSVVFWIKRKQLDTEDYIVNKGGDWTRGKLNYGVTIAPSGGYGSALGFNFAGGARHSVPITDLNWHHCAVTARNNAADAEFYIDGIRQPVVSRFGSPTINLCPSLEPLHIGAQVDASASYFSKTLVDEVKIYNRVLSATEITADYEASKSN